MSQIPALPPIATKASSSLYIDSRSVTSAPTVETKLFRLEKITETLLEEIVHLQGELTALGKNDNDELKVIRSQLKRITERQDLLQSRVANEEQKSLQKDQALTYLMQSSRDLEKKAINNQQIILCRRDVLESQFNHLQNGVNAMQEKLRTYQDQIERQLNEGSGRLEKLIESVEMQHREHMVTMRDIKLSMEAKQEAIVEEMNYKVARLHQSVDHTNNKMSILGSELLEQCDNQRRDANQWLSKLQEDIKLLVRDLNKKINNCNDAFRDRSSQLQHAMESLQQWCHVHQNELVQHCEEQLDRTNKLFQVTTKTIQSEADKRVAAQSRQLRDEMNEKCKMVQDQVQREKVKMSQLLAELHKSIVIVQKEMEMTREDTNKVIFAEIASRFREFDAMREQQSKLLQQFDQMRNELTDFTSEHCSHEIEQALDGKLQLLDHVSSQMNTLEEELKCRVSKLSCDYDRLQQDLLVWRKESITNVNDIQTTVSPLTEQLSQLEEQVEIHSQNLSNKMEAEWLERRAKLKELQKQVTCCVTMDMYQQQISTHEQRLLSLEGRVHDVALSNTKLENSLHKTEMKLVQQVSVETKQRLSAVQQIREQMALLQPHARRTSSTTPVPATPTNRVRPHRKLHNRYRLKSLSSHDDNVIQHETQGIFTSAPATPESQQNLIVQSISHDQSTDQHDQYPLLDHFSPIDPNSATSNQEFATNQHSPDKHSFNQSDQNSPSHFLNQHTSDQYSDQHLSPDVASDQHASDVASEPDQHTHNPIHTDTVQLSPTHSSN